MMFVFTGLTLLLSVGGSNAETVCHQDFCVTLRVREIRAEAGLCVVIPCSFNPNKYLTPQSIEWFKCGSSKLLCDSSDVVFSSNRENIQPGFKGRVSQVTSYIDQMDCSIIINDLKASDSGSYQLRVNGVHRIIGVDDGYTFSTRVIVTVEDLTQKPKVMVPLLTDGQQATLGCTAPGLCSASAPEITWTWRGGRKGSDTFIRGNITDFMTEFLRPIFKNHRSTLTFNSSFTKHHNTKVTCRVNFKNISTEETVTLKVFARPKILHSSRCKVHSEVLTCVCVSDGFPSPTIKWPLLANQTKTNIITTLANRMVNSTFTLTVNNHSYLAVECVSRNVVGEVKQSLTVFNSEGAEDHHGKQTLLPWTVAALSLILNVILIISVIFLWKKRKTVKSNQEDRIYMSLQKTEPSSEYDVIHQRLN